MIRATPRAPRNSVVTTAGTPVIVFDVGGTDNVADIINPTTAPGALYVDIFTTAAIGLPTSLPLQPGQSYRVSGPISTAITVVSAYNGHAFNAVAY